MLCNTLACRYGQIIGFVALAYVLLSWVPRWAPWGYRVLFWTPGALSVGLLVLGLFAMGRAGGSGTGTSPAGFGAAAFITVVPALLLNLSLFAVPSAIMRAGRRFPVGTTVLLSIGVLLYGALSVALARPGHPEGDSYSIVVSFFLLYLLAPTYIVRARRHYRKHYRVTDGPDTNAQATEESR